jgi:hypothetical protein
VVMALQFLLVWLSLERPKPAAALVLVGRGAETATDQFGLVPRGCPVAHGLEHVARVGPGARLYGGAVGKPDPCVLDEVVEELATAESWVAEVVSTMRVDVPDLVGVLAVEADRDVVLKVIGSACAVEVASASAVRSVARNLRVIFVVPFWGSGVASYHDNRRLSR